MQAILHFIFWLVMTFVAMGFFGFGVFCALFMIASIVRFARKPR